MGQCSMEVVVSTSPLPPPATTQLQLSSGYHYAGVKRLNFPASTPPNSLLYPSPICTAARAHSAFARAPRPLMRIVGLTGGISSGKSTVSNLFKANGVPVVDADVVARDVLIKGRGGWKKVVDAFGEDILLPNGEVDRPKLGATVFSDPAKRQLLNRLLAPYISSGIFQEVLKLWLKGHKVIVLDVPLLFEAKLDKWTNPVIVVWVDHEIQLQRLKARDGISDEEAMNKINAQMPLDLKRSKADIVIENNGSREDLNEQFQKVLHVVNRPLTWSEFLRSRHGVFSAIGSLVAGLLLWKTLSDGDRL